tara:strand:- start:2069 stop:3265 length:1197 start_codon:yes stop_codon:yes gene_type:complete
MRTLKTTLLLSYICIASMSAAIITPALPQIEQAYALSSGALEWVISIFLLGYVLGQLVYGPIANRFGRIKALRIGLVLNLIGILICIASTFYLDYSLLLFGRLITALGAASGLTCTIILMNELLNKDAAKQAMSYAIVSFTLGIGLAVSLGGVITQFFHWQDCFVILLIHGLVMLGLTGLFPETLKTPKPLHPKMIMVGYLTALQNSRLVIFSVLIGLVSAVSYCYSAAAPIYAQLQLHLTPGAYGYWNLLNMLGMLTSGFLGAFLIKRLGANGLLFIALSGMNLPIVSLLYLAIGQHASVLWFFLTTSMLYLFSGLVFPAASIIASNAIEDNASASGMMSFINMGSAMVAVMIMGYLPISTIWAFALTIMVFYGATVILVAFFESSECQITSCSSKS